jgi:hypothetical protein
MDWEIRKTLYRTRQLMSPLRERYQELKLGTSSVVDLFEKQTVLLKVICGGQSGPVTFVCWRNRLQFVEFKAYLSIKTNQPTARNSMRTIVYKDGLE